MPHRTVVSASRDGLQQRRATAVLLSILLASCQPTTQAELREEVDQLVTPGMPTSLAVLRLSAAEFKCAGPRRGRVVMSDVAWTADAPTPTGWIVSCTRIGPTLTDCIERLALRSEKEPSTISGIDVIKPDCLIGP
jgi:uncharacterized protein YfaS (alpha-2-macroglobulin family)